MASSNYNPDVLNCIANLSNDEVFTPPELANRVLDLLPQELFQSPNTTFLDPFTKSGVFLREIVKRLDRGLESQIQDRQARIDHIMHNQVFGVACTELTSLLARRSVYCSKFANGKFSVSHFNTESGNILYQPLKHTWVDGKCTFCGASRNVYDRDDISEQYAYQFIHTNSPESLFNMTFDVIIGNPPYQLNDGGGLGGSSATPIYDRFITQAKKLQPRFISMIIPSRWYAGGKGLDEFRDSMISDGRIRVLHDYMDAADCFPGVEIKGGVCYFLWSRDEPGLCEIITHKNGKIISQSIRPFKEKDCDIFIRFNEAVPIFKKVKACKEPRFSDKISPRQPFGFSVLTTKQKSPGCDILLYQRGGTSYCKPSDIVRNFDLVDSYKVLISKAYNAGDTYPHQVINKPFIAEKHSACTETYLTIGPWSSESECENVISYIRTKLFRFLVLLRKSSQNAAKGVYDFVPMQDFSHPWTDEMLYKKYGLTEDEIAFIDSMIRPME